LAGRLTEAFDAILSDLDGVIYRGPTAVDGAPAALRRIARAGVPVVFMTNNAARSSGTIIGELRGLGIPTRRESIVGSVDVAINILRRRVAPAAPVLVVGSASLRARVRAAGFTVASTASEHPAAVIQGLGPQVRWTDLAEAAYAIQRGAFWIATNLDETLPTASGFAPGNGALVAAVKTAAASRPTVAGKPGPEIFRIAAARVKALRPLVVGDRLDTDIVGGNRAGMATAVVLTGVTSASGLLTAPIAQRPRYILSSFAEIDAHYLPVTRDGNRYRCGASHAHASNGQLHVHGELTAAETIRAACMAWWSSSQRGLPEWHEEG